MPDKPIEPHHVQQMNALADKLHKTFHPFGFALLVFDFGEDGVMNYISNAKREDMILALEEMVGHLKGTKGA